MAKPYVSGITIREPDGSLARRHGWDIEITATLSDLQWLKANGYNSVRIVVYWKDIEKTEGVYSWSVLDAFLNNLASVGIWGIFEMHQWDWCSWFMGGKGQGIGFPAWFYDNSKGYGTYSQSGDRQKAMDEFYQKNTPNGVRIWGKFVDLWKAIVTRYKNNPYIWAWEIINEPMVGAAHVNAARAACMDRYKEIIPIIRAIDPITIIILHRIDTGYQKAVSDGNIVWTRSMYPQYSGTGTTADIAAMKSEFNDTLILPFIISETGAQTSYQSQADPGLTNMFAKVKATLNGGNNEVWNCWLYGKGINSGWQGPRNSDGTPSWLHTILAKQLTATPPPPPVNYNLTVLTPTGSGATNPGIGVHTYPSGTLVQVTALPSSNWALDHWTLNGTLPTENPVTITVTKDLNIRAVFVQAPPPDPCADVKAQLNAAQTQIATLTAQNSTLENNNQILLTTVDSYKAKIAKAIPDLQKTLQDLQ